MKTTILLIAILVLFFPATSSAQWQQTDGPYVGGIITALAESPNGSGGTNLFAAGATYGLLLSTDNGTSWTPVNSGLASVSVQSLVTSPAGNGGTNLFAGTNSDGVFLSTNNGASWTATSLTNIGVWSLAVSSNGAGGTNLFAGTYGGGVFLSTNNGTSWSTVNSGLTNYYIYSLVVSPNGAGGENLFAGTPGNGVFLSTDNGTSWTAVNSGLTDTYINSLAVSSNSAGGTNLFAGTWSSGVFLSTNNGISWTAVNSGMAGTYVYSLTVSGSNLFAGTWGSGVFLSTNNGTSWTAVNSGLTNQYISSLAVSPDGAGGMNLFAGTWGGGVWKVLISDLFPPTTSPTIVVSNKPTVLWPPNHKYTTIKVSQVVVSAKDGSGAPIAVNEVKISSVSSDESENSPGDGNTLNDIVISNDAKSVNLRAERQGGGNGRVYTINLVVKDASGTIGRASYEVWVPPNQGDKNVINDGPAYTVEAGTSLGKQVSELSLLNADQLNEFKLYDNYPNPFNPSTDIKFGLLEESFVTLTVYDMLGRTVATLVRGQLPSGMYSATFNANRLSSGIYIYRLQAGLLVETKRMVLTK